MTRDASPTALKSRLKAAGLRATQPRLSVLKHLDAQDGPRSHAEVVDALSGQGWDRATLYRNLNDLASAGLLRRMDVDHVWRFEPQQPTDAHAHFVCTDCGDVQCLPVLDIRGGGKAVSLLERSHEVQIRGVCEGCV